MKDDHSLVIVEHIGSGVTKIILNNPPLNLITLELTRQLNEVLHELNENENVRCIVITGAGSKAFCAGADIKEFPKVWDQVIEKKLAKENQALNHLELFSKPVIAAINGIAYGGGCEVAIACDIRIMEESATIGLPEIQLGVFPGAGGLFRLPRLVGPSRAMELMYLAKFISALEAEKIGLVNQVVPDGEALEKATEIAFKIAVQPMESLRSIKQAVKESFLRTLEENVKLTLELSDAIFKTEDCEEGVKAFFEKRKPQFKGVKEVGN